MSILKTTSSLAAVILLLLGVSAQAQTAKPESPWRWIGMVNMTFGGDAVEVVPMQGSSGENVRAGELFQFGGGIEYKLSEEFSAQAIVSYHTDSAKGTSVATGESGSIRFSQVPVEALLMYRVNPGMRVGLGLRHSTNVALKTTGSMTNLRSADYKNSTGVVLELEFYPQYITRVAFTARVVSQKFTENRAGAAKEDGSHIGIGAKFYF